MLPEKNTMPKSYYQANKTLCLMGIKYQKIHACPNDCILYRHEYEEMHKCLMCWVSRYKVKDDDECSSDESTKKDPQQRYYGIFRSFQGPSVCLLIQMTQKTLHGMQMGQIAMECFTIRLIPRSGRRLNICIQILRKRQEILDLDLPLTEWIPLTV